MANWNIAPVSLDPRHESCVGGRTVLTCSMCAGNPPRYVLTLISWLRTLMYSISILPLYYCLELVRSFACHIIAISILLLGVSSR